MKEKSKLVAELSWRLCIASLFIVPIVLLFVFRLAQFENFLIHYSLATWLSAPYFSRVVVVILVALAVLSLFAGYRNSVIRLRWFWLVLISLSVAILLNGIELLDQKDFKTTQTAYAKPQERWTTLFERLVQKYPNFQNNPFLIANFSTRCGHCNEFALSIQASLNGYGKSKNVVFIFWDSQADIDAFLVRNHCENIPYLKITQTELFSLMGNTYPVFQRVDHMQVVHEFYSSEFNYFERHDFFK